VAWSPLKCRHVVVGTRFCASAARPNAGNAALERQPLPILPTAFHCDPVKKSPPEKWDGVPDQHLHDKPFSASLSGSLAQRGCRMLRIDDVYVQYDPAPTCAVLPCCQSSKMYASRKFTHNNGIDYWHVSCCFVGQMDRGANVSGREGQELRGR
jgi:hypothetical protein